MDTLREELELEAERSMECPRALIGLALDFIEGLNDKERARELILEAFSRMVDEPCAQSDWRVLILAGDVLIQDVALLDRATNALLADNPDTYSVLGLADEFSGLWWSPMYGEKGSEKIKNIHEKLLERVFDTFRNDLLGTESLLSTDLLNNLLVRTPSINKAGAIDKTSELLRLAIDHANNTPSEPSLWSHIAECYAHCNQPDKADQVFLEVTQSFARSELDRSEYDLYRLELARAKEQALGLPGARDEECRQARFEERYRIGPQTRSIIGLTASE